MSRTCEQMLKCQSFLQARVEELESELQALYRKLDRSQAVQKHNNESAVKAQQQRITAGVCAFDQATFTTEQSPGKPPVLKIEFANMTLLASGLKEIADLQSRAGVLVWFGSRPEPAAGRQNWTAEIRCAYGGDWSRSVTVCVSENKQEAEYAAALTNWVLGISPTKPDILDY